MLARFTAVLTDGSAPALGVAPLVKYAQTLVLNQGEDSTITVALKNTAGAIPVVPSGAVFKLAVRLAFDAPDPPVLAATSTVIDIPTATGSFTFTGASLAALVPLFGVWDLFYVASGKTDQVIPVSTFVLGQAVVHP